MMLVNTHNPTASVVAYTYPFHPPSPCTCLFAAVEEEDKHWGNGQLQGVGFG